MFRMTFLHNAQARARCRGRDGVGGLPMWPGRDNKLKMWPGSRKLLKEKKPIIRATRASGPEGRATSCLPLSKLKEIYFWNKSKYK